MTDVYSRLGVDVSEADRGIKEITKRVKSTWPKRGLGKPQLDIGYFANVIDLGDGRGLASTTDGVGSKTIIADLLGKYDTIGIDCVAMNVNDLICVGAIPISMVDYIGVQNANHRILDDIAIGLTAGAIEAGISITGGEVSQLPDTIQGFDLVGAATGLVDLDSIIDGSRVAPGDAIIGIESNGIHSNGLTMARRVLLSKRREELTLLHNQSENDRPILEELLRPTHIYVREIVRLLEDHDVHGLVNITGDGLLNLNRVLADNVGFVLDELPEPPAIFKLIQERGSLDNATMYQTFNNGVGFCVILPLDEVKSALEVLQSFGKSASVIGLVVEDTSRRIIMPQQELWGIGKTFFVPQNPIIA